MLAEVSNHLLRQVQSVPELARTTGLRIAGGDIDPGAAEIPLPAAWVLMGCVEPNEKARAMMPLRVSLEYTGIVVVYVPYISQSDLLTKQMPLLEAVVKAVEGTNAPSGHRWGFDKIKLAGINPDRLIYELTFCCVMHF